MEWPPIDHIFDLERRLASRLSILEVETNRSPLRFGEAIGHFGRRRPAGHLFLLGKVTSLAGRLFDLER